MMNKWRKKNWIRNAKHYYIILCRLSENEAKYHSERLAIDIEKEYGVKVKNWPFPKDTVEEDYSYWER